MAPDHWLSLGPNSMNYNPRSIDSAEAQLPQWCQEHDNPLINEHRYIAAQAIRSFMKGQSDTLKLNNLQLESLPDIFDHPRLAEQMHHLVMVNCNLQSLPETLLQHPSLESLNLSNCAITEFPKFGAMPKLKKLTLSDNIQRHRRR